MYLPDTARLTVVSCTPIVSAMSPMVIGFRFDGPSSKKSRCRETIWCAILEIVGALLYFLHADAHSSRNFRKAPLAQIFHVLRDNFVFEAAFFPFTLQLNEQTLAQIARAHASWIEALDERKHLLEILLRNSRVECHFFRRALQKSVVVDVADDHFCRLTIIGTERRLVQLSYQILLKRFLRGDGIEKELALVFCFLRTAVVAARLRHVIAPFLI